MAFLFSRLSRRPALFPPRGEEKEERQAVEATAHSASQLSVGSADRKVATDRRVGALRDGSRGGRDRQRLLGDQRRSADHGERLRHQRQHHPVGGERLRAHLRGDDRHRRPSRRPVRSPQRLLPRHGDLRDDVGAGWRRAERGLADRHPHPDGDRRGADVAGDPRHDLRPVAGGEGGAGGWCDPRRRRPRQRDRPAARRRPHRRAELALDLLPQRAGLDLRRRRHLVPGPGPGARGGRAPRRLRGSRRSRPASSRF
jgi:hypothetical protein